VELPLKRKKNPGRCLRFDHGVKDFFSFNGKPENRAFFFEEQHEIKSPAWSGKTADGLLARSLDCHTTAEMMPYEDAS
jgi:hypothetical protein